MDMRHIIDRTLEATVVPSFTRIGSDVRSKLFDWTDLDEIDLAGRTVAITGATSGLGLAAATSLASMGADLIVIGRSPDRLADAVTAIDEARRGPGKTVHVVADLSDFDEVRAAANRVLDETDRLDVLIHNAGALSAERSENDDGVEMTVAAQVDGPFLLTSLLLDRLAATPPGRVVTMSSGGMYTAPLLVDRLEMGDDYDGTTQYARAKRAQVTLNELWSERVDPGSVVFHAMHPGWADTPGVSSSLPGFARVMGPLLRSPEDGADTMVWLAAADEPLDTSGGFWLDRHVRPIHRLPSTRRSDTSERRAELWERCVRVTGAEPPPPAADAGPAPADRG